MSTLPGLEILELGGLGQGHGLFSHVAYQNPAFVAYYRSLTPMTGGVYATGCYSRGFFQCLGPRGNIVN